MKISYLLAAALALATAPGRAAAASQDDRPQAATQNDTSDPGVGSAADSDHSNVGSDCGTVGSSDQATGEQNVGGSAASDHACGEGNVGGAGTEFGAAPAPGASRVVVIPSTTEHEKTKAPNQGVALTANGGVEGYTGTLAPRVDAGGSWGVMLTGQPNKIVGLELGYSGAVNNIDDPAASGGQIVRNGGTANLKFSLYPSVVEPYLFGGVGFAHNTVTHTAHLEGGYRGDTFGMIPVGGGLNFHIGKFTAGARGSYDFLFSRNFSPNSHTGFGFGSAYPNIWSATGQLGGQF